MRPVKMSNQIKSFAGSAFLALAFVGCNLDGDGSEPPAASPPVLEKLNEADIALLIPNPESVPSLSSVAVKFLIPSRTVIQVSIDGTILNKKSDTCGDEGCYITRFIATGNDQTSHVIQIFPPVNKRSANQVEVQLIDLSLNPSFSGEQKASEPVKVIITEAGNPVTGGKQGLSSVRGTPPWAAINGVDFLKFASIGQGKVTDAEKYYGLIDPKGEKTTLANWKAINGFATDDSQDDAKADYFNAGDLNFGRSMHMKEKSNGDLAYYVTNHPTARDAIRRTNLLATVSMEYSTTPPGLARFVKFYVYDKDGNRIPAVDLDGNGPKAVPNLCVICHGLTPYTGGASADLGSQFLPFDISSFQFDESLGRIAQESEFTKLNLAILKTNPSTAMISLIKDTWYKTGRLTTSGNKIRTQFQLVDAVPSGWKGHEELYLNVIKPSCRSCHISRGPELDFASYASFESSGSSIQSILCAQREMPNAKVSYEKFWQQSFAKPYKNAAGLLNQSNIKGWDPTRPCPDPR